MYAVSTPEVILLDRARAIPESQARTQRMLNAIEADRIVEVDDAGLASLVEERGWNRLEGRTGQHRMARHPSLIFNAFRWASDSKFAGLRRVYPSLGAHMLLGNNPWTFRDHAKSRAEQNCVCQSAWEFHCAYGCLHACDYCHVPPYFNIMTNLEELAQRIRAFGETIPEQKLYKFDNYTDTICLEPEYGASKTMVETFADWPGRYLLLYTKSDNVEHLLGLGHRGHTLISWSLGCDSVAEHIEKGTPSLDRRLEAMAKCEKAGYRVRARISPMCPVKNWREEYGRLVTRLLNTVTPEVVSIDVIGWMSAAQMKSAIDISLFEDAFAEVVEKLSARGAPKSGKHLFPHAMRADMQRFVIEEIKRLRPAQPVSLCMETADMWRELGPLIGMGPENYVCCCGPTSAPGNPLLSTDAAE